MVPGYHSCWPLVLSRISKEKILIFDNINTTYVVEKKRCLKKKEAAFEKKDFPRKELAFQKKLFQKKVLEWNLDMIIKYAVDSAKQFPTKSILRPITFTETTRCCGSLINILRFRCGGNFGRFWAACILESDFKFDQGSKASLSADYKWPNLCFWRIFWSKPAFVKVKIDF